MSRGVPSAARRYQARVTVHAPAAAMAERIGPWVGTVDADRRDVVHPRHRRGQAREPGRLPGHARRGLHGHRAARIGRPPAGPRRPLRSSRRARGIGGDVMSYPEPRYHGAAGETSATYRPADQGPDLTYPNGNTAHYLATGATTDGLFGLYRWEMGRNPPFVLHTWAERCGSTTASAGSIRSLVTSSTSRRAASTAFGTSRANRRRCCSISRLALHGKATSRVWPRSRPRATQRRGDGRVLPPPRQHLALRSRPLRLMRGARVAPEAGPLRPCPRPGTTTHRRRATRRR